jgi:hypothetical protein
MKNAVFCDVTPCATEARSEEILFRLLVTANVVHNSPILVTLIIEEICSSETMVLTRATRRNDPEDGILQMQESS